MAAKAPARAKAAAPPVEAKPAPVARVKEKAMMILAEMTAREEPRGDYQWAGCPAPEVKSAARLASGSERATARTWCAARAENARSARVDPLPSLADE